MCSPLLTYSDIQEFKTNGAGTEKFQHEGAIETFIFLTFRALTIAAQQELHRPDGCQFTTPPLCIQHYWLLIILCVDTHQSEAPSVVLFPSLSLSLDHRVLFVGCLVMFSPPSKCTSNGSLILHPCDVTAHLTNTIRGNSGLWLYFCSIKQVMFSISES